MPQSVKRIAAITVAVSMIISSNGAWAQTPNELSDLVDARGRDAESQMESRGYVSHHTSKSDNAAYSSIGGTAATSAACAYVPVMADMSSGPFADA
jgi:hypothetical protein